MPQLKPLDWTSSVNRAKVDFVIYEATAVGLKFQIRVQRGFTLKMFDFGSESSYPVNSLEEAKSLAYNLYQTEMLKCLV